MKASLVNFVSYALWFVGKCTVRKKTEKMRNKELQHKNETETLRGAIKLHPFGTTAEQSEARMPK